MTHEILPTMDLWIRCATGEGTLVWHKRVQEGDQHKGLSKRVKRVPETEGTPVTELWDLLEEVLETNWLLHQLWHTVVEGCQEACRLM